MRLRILLFFLFLFNAIPLFSHYFPKEFSIKPQCTTTQTVFFLEDLDKKLVVKVLKIEESAEILHYKFFDRDENLMGIAKVHVADIPERDFLHFSSESESFSGTITREKSALTPSKYYIYDDSETLLASGTMNWLGTRLTLTSPLNPHHEHAMFYRPYFRLPGDRWYIKIEDKNTLDPRMIALLIVFQCDCETKHCTIKK